MEEKFPWSLLVIHLETFLHLFISVPSRWTFNVVVMHLDTRFDAGNGFSKWIILRNEKSLEWKLIRITFFLLNCDEFSIWLPQESTANEVSNRHCMHPCADQKYTWSTTKMRNGTLLTCGLASYLHCSRRNRHNVQLKLLQLSSMEKSHVCCRHSMIIAAREERQQSQLCGFIEKGNWMKTSQWSHSHSRPDLMLAIAHSENMS